MMTTNKFEQIQQSNFKNPKLNTSTFFFKKKHPVSKTNPNSKTDVEKYILKQVLVGTDPHFIDFDKLLFVGLIIFAIT